MRGAVAALGVALGACGGGDDKPELEDFLPEVPSPTGEAQSVWAGVVESDAELIPGPAASGMMGDVFLRNSRARFVVQAPARVIGVVPQGGNLVDAVPRDGDSDAAVDHFGELSMVYLAGRTCRHDSLEIVHDGAGGGAAVVRAVGVTEANDFINLRGIGLVNIPEEIDPDLEDGAQCATTYVLQPDSASIEVYWTLFNPGDIAILGPIGALNDTGGDVASFGRTRGFESLGIESLASSTDPAPVDYVVYQGPKVAYGILPRHDDAALTNSSFQVAGVSVVLFGAEKLLDILNQAYWDLELPARTGSTYRVDVSVGFDAGDAEEAFFSPANELAEIAGHATWQVASTPALDARVGVYEDADGDGALGPDDLVITYFDVDDQGRFSGRLVPGNYLVNAEVSSRARSTAQRVDVGGGGATGIGLTLPDPVVVDYTISDLADGSPIPARVQAIGRHPVEPDARLFSRFDGESGVVALVNAIRGSSSLGDDPDPPLVLAPGTYRVYASRGTEWSIASADLVIEAGQAVAPLDLELVRVIDTTGYIASEYHVHQVGSPDSPVLSPARVRSAAAEGVELFAVTDHDYVSDLQPVVEELDLAREVRVVPGLEVTPFVYGHFNTWPLVPDTSSPNRGAVDWARGMEGFAMIPDEIFAAMRARGGEVVQINHPRSDGGLTDFQQFFDRAGLAFDFDRRMITGELLRQPVPNDWLRLPGTSLWSSAFNALEVWNGFGMSDTDGDGMREMSRLDMVMRDWFNFLSMGLAVTPIGSSDTHNVIGDPMGLPRTYVRVTDDSPAAFMSGTVTDDVIDTLAGRNGAPRDVVLSNGPFIRFRQSTQTDGESAIGRVLLPDGDGSVTLIIDVQSPLWALFDMVEVFANETLDVGLDVDVSALTPRYCYSARPTLPDNAPCHRAIGGRAQMVLFDDGFFSTRITLTLRPGDIPPREGATGPDTWVVVRASGDVATFPLVVDGLTSGSGIDIVTEGTPNEIYAHSEGRGVPATALTAPIYIDFDGDGYQAIFAP